MDEKNKRELLEREWERENEREREKERERKRERKREKETKREREREVLGYNTKVFPYYKITFGNS